MAALAAAKLGQEGPIDLLDEDPVLLRRCDAKSIRSARQLRQPRRRFFCLKISARFSAVAPLALPQVAGAHLRPDHLRGSTGCLCAPSAPRLPQVAPNQQQAAAMPLDRQASSPFPHSPPVDGAVGDPPFCAGGFFLRSTLRRTYALGDWRKGESARGDGCCEVV